MKNTTNNIKIVRTTNIYPMIKSEDEIKLEVIREVIWSQEDYENNKEYGNLNEKDD